MRFRLPVRTAVLLSAAFLFLSAFPPLAFAQVAPPASAVNTLPSPLTLQQALAIALKQQPSRYIALSQTRQTLGQKTQAKSQYYPNVAPTYTYRDVLQTVTRSSQTFVNTGGTGTGTGGTGTGTGTGTGDGTGTGTGIGTGTGTGTGGGTNPGVPTPVISTRQDLLNTRGGSSVVGLTQRLFDTGQREIANAQARRAVDSARANQTNIRQQIIFNVTQNFYDLLRAYDLVTVAQAQASRAQQTLDITQAQITAGTIPAKDAFQSRADLANAQVSLLQNQTQLQTTSAALKNSMGVETDQTVQPAPLAGEGRLPPLPASGAERTLDNYVQQAYRDRPDLVQQRANVEVEKLNVKDARIANGLQVAGDYQLSYTPTNDTGLHNSLNSQFLLSASYPLFNAGSTRAGVQIAEARRDSSLSQLEQLRQSVRLDVEQAFLQRSQTLEQGRLAQAAVDAAQVNFDAATAARREGAGTVQDITLAQLSLTQAQNQYVTAIYDFYVADARLRKALGQNEAVPGAPTGP